MSIHASYHMERETGDSSAMEALASCRKPRCPIGKFTHGCQSSVAIATEIPAHLLSCHSEEERELYESELWNAGYGSTTGCLFCPICRRSLKNHHHFAQHIHVDHLVEQGGSDATHVLQCYRTLQRTLGSSFRIGWSTKLLFQTSLLGGKALVCPSCDESLVEEHDPGLATYTRHHLKIQKSDVSEVFKHRREILRLYPEFSFHSIFDDLRDIPPVLQPLRLGTLKKYSSITEEDEFYTPQSMTNSGKIDRVGKISIHSVDSGYHSSVCSDTFGLSVNDTIAKRTPRPENGEDEDDASIVQETLALRRRQIMDLVMEKALEMMGYETEPSESSDGDDFPMDSFFHSSDPTDVDSQPNQGSSSTTSTFSGSLSQQNSIGRGKKRSKQDAGHGEDGGEDGNSKRPRTNNQTPHCIGGRRMLACPYRKRLPLYQNTPKSCVHPGFINVHRLKEHLFRVHALPEIHCGDCLQGFDSFRDLTKHLKPNDGPSPCPGLCAQPITSFGSEQRKTLKERQGKGLSEETKWIAVWKVLFGDDEEALNNIPSPYYEAIVPIPSPTETQFAQYEHFQRDMLPQLVQQRIESVLDEDHRVETLAERIISRLPEIIRAVQEENSYGFPSFNASSARGELQEGLATDSLPASTTTTRANDFGGMFSAPPVDQTAGRESIEEQIPRQAEHQYTRGVSAERSSDSGYKTAKREDSSSQAADSQSVNSGNALDERSSYPHPPAANLQNAWMTDTASHHQYVEHRTAPTLPTWEDQVFQQASNSSLPHEPSATTGPLFTDTSSSGYMYGTIPQPFMDFPIVSSSISNMDTRPGQAQIDLGPHFEAVEQDAFYNLNLRTPSPSGLDAVEQGTFYYRRVRFPSIPGLDDSKSTFSDLDDSDVVSEELVQHTTLS